MTAVPLPPRDRQPNQTPIWSYSEENNASQLLSEKQEVPPAKCEVANLPDRVCCRSLKDEDERTLVNPDVVKDIVIGLSDGLTVPFGLTAGLAAFGNTRVVVIGGVAELISGSISMGVGGYLSAKAEQDHYRYLLNATRRRIKRSCAGEIEREVTEVLGTVGLDESGCRRVAHSLMKVEQAQDANGDFKDTREDGLFTSLLHHIARRSRRTSFDTEKSTTSSQATATGDVGLTAFLMKFGEGQEPVPNSRLLISALTIGGAYAVGGIIPLIPYFCFHRIMPAFYTSIALTAITLVIFGLVKAYFTGSKIGWKGYTKASVLTLVIGGMAAGSAYGISRAIESSK